MPKSSDITIVEARCSFESIPFRSPLKFGGRVMDQGTLINVDVLVETRNKRRASGSGSMPCASVWAWPSATVSTEQADGAMKAFASELIELAGDYPDYAHPIDITEQMLGEFSHLAKLVQQKQKLAEPLPYLAQLVAGSPLDAALHDAYGRVHSKNSFDCLSSEYMNHDLSEYLDASFRSEYLDKYTLRAPQAKLPIYHLVGALDPLSPGDVEKKIGDGLPEHLGEWIAYNGLTHLKIKLNGDDLKWDVDRVLSVERVAAEGAEGARGCKAWHYSLDFNEKCADVGYVLDFLGQVRKAAPAAYDRIQYIEQPTHRDLQAHPENKMHEAAKLKPVVIDESLVDFDSLLLAREQGYTGIALKACKGQTGSLLLGAAQKQGMFLCVQDLTCPGFSFLHSASLAAHIPGVAAVEGNGRQYCPNANRRWRAQYPAMFDISDGTVGTGVLNGVGLGF